MASADVATAKAKAKMIIIVASHVAIPKNLSSFNAAKRLDLSTKAGVNRHLAEGAAYHEFHSLSPNHLCG